MAWAAAEVAGSPHERVFILLPPDVAEPSHVLGLSGDQLVWRVPSIDSSVELAAFASRLAERIKSAGVRVLGDLAPLARSPEWLLRPHIPPSERFTGRAKDLWHLHNQLHADRILAITGRGARSTAQVRGMGGIGKTLLAVEYVARFGPSFPGGIFWVDTAGRAPDEVVSDVAIRLGYSPSERNAALAALAERGRYLWIVDNLPPDLTQQQVEAWCAPTAQGRTLITTRSRTWDALGKALDLDVLAADEALALLALRRPPVNAAEKECARLICEQVGYHPLTLDVLATLIARHPAAAPYAAWVDLLAAPSEDALRLGEALKEELPTGSARYIGTVLQASIEGLAAEALDLLLLAVSLAEAPIPADLAVKVFEEMESASPAKALARWMVGVEAAQARNLLDQKNDPAHRPAILPDLHSDFH